MGWEFEHWDNGKVYLHEERWQAFRKNLEKNGNGYPHNWLHERILVRLHSPRDNIHDVPCPGMEHLKYKVEDYDDSWSVVYQPFPAFMRTAEDPEGWLPSWNIWAENRHVDPLGEKLTLITTGDIFDRGDGLISFGRRVKNIFANFQNKFWRVDQYHNYGIGPNPPPPPPPKKKRLLGRDIFEPFESW